MPPGPKFLEIDSMVIPLSSNRKFTAEFFLNFLLIPQISGALSNYSFYANSNEVSRPYIHREILLGPSYVIAPRGTSIFLQDLGKSDQIYFSEWARLVASVPPIETKVPLRLSPRETVRSSDIITQ